MYNSLIKQVKASVDIIDVARKYGINVNRNNKALCCFHKEKTPSLSFHKEKQIYKCFSCGKGGDVISLVSELLNINALEAAKSINYTLGLGLDPNQKSDCFQINKYKNKQKTEEMFKKWELNTFLLLTDYLHLLWKWEEENTPENMDEDPNELYVEAMHNRDYIEYLIDTIFIDGTNEDKIWFWKHEKKVARRIESRVRTYRTTRE